MSVGGDTPVEMSEAMRRFLEQGLAEGACRKMSPPAGQARDPGRKGVAVPIRLDRIEDLPGRIIIERDPAAP